MDEVCYCVINLCSNLKEIANSIALSNNEGSIFFVYLNLYDILNVLIEYCDVETRSDGYHC